MKKILSAVQNLINQFNQTEFDKKTSGIKATNDKDGIAVRYRW